MGLGVGAVIVRAGRALQANLGGGAAGCGRMTDSGWGAYEERMAWYLMAMSSTSFVAKHDELISVLRARRSTSALLVVWKSYGSLVSRAWGNGGLHFRTSWGADNPSVP